MPFPSSHTDFLTLLSCPPTTSLLCSISHVVSQSDVLMFLHKRVHELGPLADVTLQQLGLATKPVVCVPAEMATVKAFASMVVSLACLVLPSALLDGGGMGTSSFCTGSAARAI
jgi:hypothetical protein